ncbi:MAG: hypothetical protein ABJ056_09380 [Halioglobus sp.]
MKKWLHILMLLLPVLVVAQEQEDTINGWEAAEPDEALDLETNWLDDTHIVATDSAQALTEWMDNFFGDPQYNLEQAESQLRLKFINDWESEDGYQADVRLRGKVQLPKISKRLNLVFAGDDSDLDGVDELRENDDGVALQYNVKEGTRSRFDLALGWSSGPRPGVRYRNEGSFNEQDSYRFIERVQYDLDDGFESKSQLDLNRALDQNNIIQWSNRVVYGEESDGVEWRSRVALRQRRNTESDKPSAFNYIASVNGVTSPQSFVKNYRLAVLWRRQIYRDYLFLELEPGYNFRKRNNADKRDTVFSMTVNIEIALQRDLRRVRKPSDTN